MTHTNGYEQTEFGLKLPNGNIQWGTALTQPITTETERSTMIQIVSLTAERLGWPPEEFVGRYRWVSRTVIEDNGEYALDDPAVAPPITPSPADFNQ